MSNGPVSRPRRSRYLIARIPAGVVAGRAKLGLGIGLPVVWSFMARKPVSVNAPSLPSRQEMPVAGSGNETVSIQSWFERIGISFGM